VSVIALLFPSGLHFLPFLPLAAFPLIGFLFPTLQTKSLWGNSLTDILHHESIHAAREAFNEPQFEEVLAYSISSSPWKRFLGPLFQRMWEFPLCLASLFFFPYTFPVPAFFFFRLVYKQILFHRLKKKVPLPAILCLTDREIRTLAFSRKNFNPDLSPRGCLLSSLINS
jgi:hypothetical protein